MSGLLLRLASQALFSRTTEYITLALRSDHEHRADMVNVRRQAAKGLERLLAIAVIAAFQMVVNPSTAQTSCDPLAVAKKYIARRYPSFDPAGKKLSITESASQWRVTYELPPGTLGGVPVVTIDKLTCAIVRAEHTQ